MQPFQCVQNPEGAPAALSGAGTQALVDRLQELGKGRKIPLRFSKFGDPDLEAAHSTHYLSPRLVNEKARPDGFATSPAEAGSVVPDETADAARKAIREGQRADIPYVAEIKRRLSRKATPWWIP